MMQAGTPAGDVTQHAPTGGGEQGFGEQVVPTPWNVPL
jgi:hypothetical protein